MKLALLLACLLPCLVSGAELPLVILLGDSILMNYQDAVREDLSGKAEVWAPKENGQHTFHTLTNIAKWIDGRKPAVIHINVGLHDLFLNSKTDQPRHSLETYETNLRAIFAKLRELTDARIVFALTSVVIEERQASSKTYKRVVRRNPDIARYNSAARKIAGEMNIAINDLNAFMTANNPAELLREDGIHLSPTGCKIVGSRVASEIRRQLPPSAGQ